VAGTKQASDKSLPTLAVELKDMVVSYAKQETVEPLKGLARFLQFGIPGSILLAAGLGLLVLGLLRGLQTETGTWFDGNWTVVPYVITLAFCVIVIALTARAIGAPSRRAKETSK
jgi:hypothetical protein